MVVSITSDKNLKKIKDSLVRKHFVEELQPELTNKEITISDGYSKIYENLQDDSEIYEKELIKNLIKERERFEYCRMLKKNR